MRRSRGLCAIYLTIAAAVSLIAVPPSPCGADRFAMYNMRVLDRITNIVAADLDGDGQEDLVVLHTKGRSPDVERWISIFWHKPDGSFSSAADLTWELPDEVAAVDTGDLTEDRGVEILALTTDGVSVIGYPSAGDRSSLEPIVRGVNGSILPSRNEVPIVDFAQDWNGDGMDDLAVPGFGELYLFLTGGDTLSAVPQICELETQIDLSVSRGENGSRFGAVDVTRKLPHLAGIDLDGDGDKDLVTYMEDVVRFHLQENGRFSRVADSKVEMNLITSDDTDEDDYELEVSVLDVDGDGLADLFGGKSISRGVGDFSSTVALHYGDGTLGFVGEPDWTTTVEGMSAGKWLDLDGDGRMELMMPIINLGITDIVRILISKKVKVDYYFYFPAEDRSISDEPDFMKEVTLDVGFEEGGEAQIVSFEGDYNGDGRRDLVIATGGMELSVFLGKEPSKGELFSRKPVERIEVDTFGDFKPLNLNGDDKQDMILFYSRFPEKSSKARIFLNIGEW